MLECETGRALMAARHYERSYLDDLAVAARRCARLALRYADVLLCGGDVALVRGPYSEQGDLDRVHAATVRFGADLGLTSH